MTLPFELEQGHIFCLFVLLARPHFSAEELLLYPRRPRPHAKC